MMARTARRLAVLLLAVVLLIGDLCPITAAAEKTKSTGNQLVLTLAKDISSDEKANILKYFGVKENSPFVQKYPRIKEWMDKDGTNMITGPVDNTYKNNLYLDLPGFSTEFFVAKGLNIPEGRTTVGGNMYVRTKGLAEGALDFATGDASKIPDNKHTNDKAYRMLSLDLGVKVLDGTPEEPIDLGFVRVPGPSFDVSDYYWEQQGWVDEDKLRAKREAGYEQKPYDVGDFTLKPDARLLKEMPGFKPIPFEKIGLYKDEWRSGE